MTFLVTIQMILYGVMSAAEFNATFPEPMTIEQCKERVVDDFHQLTQIQIMKVECDPR